MPYYRVIGRLAGWSTCGCPICGNEHEHRVKVNVEKVIEAASPEEASDKVLAIAREEEDFDSSVDWSKDTLAVSHLPEDQYMHHISAPMLFDLSLSEA